MRSASCQTLQVRHGESVLWRTGSLGFPGHAACTHNASARVLRPMKKFFVIVFSLVSSAFAQNAKHPFTFEDMMKLKRVGAPVPSPDGKWIVFDCVDVDLQADTRISHLWVVSASGGDSRRLNPT